MCRTGCPGRWSGLTAVRWTVPRSGGSAGVNTYVFATLIIWVMTSISDIAARQLIRARRDKRAASR
jgi:hypothetical protein